MLHSLHVHNSVHLLKGHRCFVLYPVINKGPAMYYVKKANNQSRWCVIDVCNCGTANDREMNQRRSVKLKPPKQILLRRCRDVHFVSICFLVRAPNCHEGAKGVKAHIALLSVLRKKNNRTMYARPRLSWVTFAFVFPSVKDAACRENTPSGYSFCVNVCTCFFTSLNGSYRICHVYTISKVTWQVRSSRLINSCQSTPGI